MSQKKTTTVTKEERVDPSAQGTTLGDKASQAWEATKETASNVAQNVKDAASSAKESMT